MSRRKIYLYSGFIIILFFSWLFSASKESNEQFPETVKIALREVGNQLLLFNQDSTSLVLPVVELKTVKYQLSFQNELSIEPNHLTSTIDSSFTKSDLPNNYIVEVIQCSDEEVAYSYKKTTKKESTIIPCGGRFLPKSCYRVEVNFNNKMASLFNEQTLLYLLILIILVFLLDFVLYRKKQAALLSADENFAAIGSFQFYPEQNKLVKKAIEISLSKKECELLEILVANANQIVKRDELEKRVWEDNGVVVGRSLDTYISKLRKKLQEDDSIKITNVHGVGYKLEVT